MYHNSLVMVKSLCFTSLLGYLNILLVKSRIPYGDIHIALEIVISIIGCNLKEEKQLITY